MKIKSDYILHSVGDEYMVVAVGERTKEFCGMIRLNATGAFIWKQMEQGCTKEELEASMLDNYDITLETAKEAVDTFLQNLSGVDVIDYA